MFGQIITSILKISELKSQISNLRSILAGDGNISNALVFSIISLVTY